MTQRRSTGDLTAEAQAWADRRPHVFLDLYTGLQPASANDAPTGTKLLTYSKDGAYTGATDGFSFGTAVGGVVARNPSEIVRGTGVANGVAGWARLRAYTDSGISSTTDLRQDYSVGLAGSGADIILTSVNFVTGNAYIMDGLTHTARNPA